MRISSRIQDTLLKSITEAFGNVHVYLFGSRVDDTKQGGDIDLAIQVDISKAEFRKKKIACLTSLERMGFDLKIDIVPYTKNNPFLFSEIQKNHVQLI